MEYAKKEIERYQKTINNINVNQYKNQLMFISMDNFITLRLLSEGFIKEKIYCFTRCSATD